MQAENRYETLWSSKQNTEFAVHENWVQTGKKRQVQSQAVLASPRRPRSDVGGGRSQPDTPALCEVSLQACPGEGTGAGHRSWLKGHRPRQGSSFPRSKPHLCTGASLPFGPLRSPTTNARSEEPGGPGDLVSRQLTVRWGRRGEERRPERSDSIRRKGTCRCKSPIST